MTARRAAKGTIFFVTCSRLTNNMEIPRIISNRFVARGLNRSKNRYKTNPHINPANIPEIMEMGITARGAWECIKRHFREEGKNIQEESINVIGIGDMAGDVFGNGMLLSRKIKLVGAFNHLHIFLDPDPDTELSFKERTRLFNLPGSSWTDYKSELISDGGGVYLRSAKSIPVSDLMRRHLGTTKKSVNGEEMIRLLLKAGVDLLYNGGVGTYIKAKSEGKIGRASCRERV